MSHYITCHNCGEPECMDSDTGVHRRDDGTVCPDPRDAEVEGLRAEVARLRAAAIPEDAEEIVFKELSIGVFEPQDLEIQEAIHAKRRAKARAVVKALRRDA